ncbi:hypothetical protein M405DRAFT_835467 [Rhizopogon salebrosus TDB-379]|nr:hypothetical protein M405DRAFT_835467 [Rhizopogon salebrosus TDB-379]
MQIGAGEFQFVGLFEPSPVSSLHLSALHSCKRTTPALQHFTVPSPHPNLRKTRSPKPLAPSLHLNINMPCRLSGTFHCTFLIPACKNAAHFNGLPLSCRVQTRSQ